MLVSKHCNDSTWNKVTLQPWTKHNVCTVCVCVHTLEWATPGYTWLTQPAIDDGDGAVELLDGLAVLLVHAVSQTQLVVSLCEQAAVWVQVFQLQLQTLLEILQSLCVVSCKRESDLNIQDHLICFFFFFQKHACFVFCRKLQHSPNTITKDYFSSIELLISLTTTYCTSL